MDKPEILSLRPSIVLVGQFNPAIFHPAWFASKEIVGEKEAESANVEVVHANLAKMSFDNYDIQVLNTQFSITQTQASNILIKDVVINTFKNHLPHSPIVQVGINCAFVIDMRTEEQRNDLGNKLAPHDAWGNIAKLIDCEDRKIHGGLVTMTMRAYRESTKYKGFTDIKLGPVQTSPSRVSVQINDHYELVPINHALGTDEIMKAVNQFQNQGEIKTAEEIMEIVDNSFDESLKKSRTIVDELL